MNNKKNIIICLLTLIFILNFLIFLKLKTYRIDNFTDSTQPISYSLIGDSLGSSNNLKYAQWYYMFIQSIGYSILLQMPLKNDDNGIIGLIIFLSYKINLPTFNVWPILEQIAQSPKLISTNSQPVIGAKREALKKAIQDLQSSFNTEQIAGIEQSVQSFVSVIITEQKLKDAISGINNYRIQNLDNTLIMNIFANIKETLKPTDIQLKNIKFIINNFPINSNFTTEKFKMLSMPINGTPNEYIPWKKFFSECKI